MAHLWARWLHNPCRLMEPLRFRAREQNQKWPTCGQGGYITTAVSGSPSASKRVAESEVAHLWARWLHNPCRLRRPLRFRAGGQNQKWPTCGQGGYITLAASGSPSASERGAESEVADLWAGWLPNPCRLREPLRFRAGGQNQKWPTCGQGGYITPAALGIPSASERGGRIRSGPLLGKVAT